MEKDPFKKIKPKNPFDNLDSEKAKEFKKLKASIENFSKTEKKNLGLKLENFDSGDRDLLIKLIEILTDRYSDQEVVDKIFELTNCSEAAIEVFKLYYGINGKEPHTEEKIAEIMPNQKTGGKGMSISRVQQYRRKVEGSLLRAEIREYIKNLEY